MKRYTKTLWVSYWDLFSPILIKKDEGVLKADLEGAFCVLPEGCAIISGGKVDYLKEKPTSIIMKFYNPSLKTIIKTREKMDEIKERYKPKRFIICSSKNDSKVDFVDSSGKLEPLIKKYISYKFKSKTNIDYSIAQ